jgi:SpoVK/Ycf46/Vps4 family AAA+-type ATPase
MLYLGVSDNHTAQLNILRALTRKFKLSPDMDLAAVADSCPFNYTGADFYALCSDAMLKAMTRVAWEVDGRIGTFVVLIFLSVLFALDKSFRVSPYVSTSRTAQALD